MKKAGIIVTSLVVLVLLGGLIVVWSAYQRKEAPGAPSSPVKVFTDDNFESDVIQASANRPIVVDFHAEWCIPCRMLDPIIEEVAKETLGKVDVGKLDTDKNMVSRKLGITKIPAVWIVKDGQIKDIFYGVVPKDTIVRALRDYGH